MKKKYINTARKQTITVALLLLLTGTLITGCKKYLDEPSAKTLAIPQTLDDLKAMLNVTASIIYGNSFGEEAADNFYYPTAYWQNMMARSADYQAWALTYVWDGDPHSGTGNTGFGWDNMYRYIYTYNLVLEVIPTISPDGNKDQWNFVKGAALFYRANLFHQLAQIYCRPYSNTAASDPGIVLRQTSDLNQPTVRATVQETYDLIIKDLSEAANRLPETTTYQYQPTKCAAFAALSRTYLSMRDYPNAKRFADSALARNSYLLDYNTLTPGTTPIPKLNGEVLFYQQEGDLGGQIGINGFVDSTLYKSYDANDLRKSIFFRLDGAGCRWQGSYAYFGSAGLTYDIFLGLATDELYLTRAECNARGGNTIDALSDLNKLMVKRWKTSAWVPFTATDASSALSLILTERRKELCFRGIRWMDLRRFNLESANITLKRIIAGNTFTLPPNDLRWVMLIPWNTINLGGIQQNPR